MGGDGRSDSVNVPCFFLQCRPCSAKHVEIGIVTVVSSDHWQHDDVFCWGTSDPHPKSAMMASSPWRQLPGRFSRRNVRGSGANITTNVQALHTCRRLDGLPHNRQGVTWDVLGIPLKIRWVIWHQQNFTFICPPKYVFQLSTSQLNSWKDICYVGFAPRFGWGKYPWDSKIFSSESAEFHWRRSLCQVLPSSWAFSEPQGWRPRTEQSRISPVMGVSTVMGVPQ